MAKADVRSPPCEIFDSAILNFANHHIFYLCSKLLAKSKARFSSAAWAREARLSGANRLLRAELGGLVVLGAVAEHVVSCLGLPSVIQD